MSLTRLECTSPAFAALCANLLNAGIALRFTAQGSSMKPMLRPGDILVVKPVQKHLIKIGDIVLCTVYDSRVVAHRVIGKRTGKNGLVFLLQGDRVSKPDGWVAEDMVHGRVESAERCGRYINLLAQTARLLGIMQTIKLRFHLSRLGVAEAAGRVIKRLPCFVDYMT